MSKNALHLMDNTVDQLINCMELLSGILLVPSEFQIVVIIYYKDLKCRGQNEGR